MKSSPLFRTSSNKAQATVSQWVEEQLSHFRVPYESTMLDTSIGYTHVLTAGSRQAPPLVVLHGFGVNAAAMEKAISFFSQNFRVYALDIPGQPGKSFPVRLPYDGTFIQWLSESLDLLKVPQAHFYGISLGGWLALRLASQEPERVQGCVLVGPAGFVPLRKRFWLHLVSRLLMYHVASSKQNLLKILQPLFSPNTTPDDRLVELFGIFLKSMKLDRIPIPLFAPEMFADYKAPTFIAVAEHDALFDPVKLHLQAQSTLPHAIIEDIAGAGHVMSSQHIDEVHAHALAFLQAHHEPILALN